MNDNNKIEKYAEDIAVIKSILMKVEEKSLIEYWAFYAWGGLILLGAFIEYFTVRAYGTSMKDIFIMIWIPALLLGSFLETIAWIRNLRKKGLPLFSRQEIKLCMTLIGYCAAAGMVIFIMFESGLNDYLPVSTQLLIAGYILIYAQTSHFHLYFYSYFLIMTAVIMYYLPLTAEIRHLSTGIIVGLTMIFAGYSSYKKEKEQND